MKILLSCIFACLLSASFAQNGRRLRFQVFPRDSINLHMDENYFLIEDTCSSIIRYGHYRTKDKKFFGPFRDLNKLDTQIVLAEGKYTEDGQLDGNFTMNFLNGDLLAKGNFDRGKMTGHWMINYPENKKKLEFENKEGVTYILNAWDKDGKAIVAQGTGSYRSDLGQLFWEGKIADGRPDGTWRLKKTDDRTGTIISSETYKNGKFVKGGGPVENYTDESRIVMVGENLLPITNSALMRLSPQACDPSMSRKKIVYATYKGGLAGFNQEIINVVGPVFQTIDLSNHIPMTFIIEGVINEKGKIVDLQNKDTFYDKAAGKLLLSLYRLPYLEPTLLNNIAVPNGIIFKFTISQGRYSYSWSVLPQNMSKKVD